MKILRRCHIKLTLETTSISSLYRISAGTTGRKGNMKKVQIALAVCLFAFASAQGAQEQGESPQAPEPRSVLTMGKKVATAGKDGRTAARCVQKTMTLLAMERRDWNSVMAALPE
jgi:uncharacterized lipoprotein YajG